MQEKEIHVVKNGKQIKGTIFVPETLTEFVGILTETECVTMLQRAYQERAKARLRNGGHSRKRILKIKLRELSQEQRIALTTLGLLRGE